MPKFTIKPDSMTIYIPYSLEGYIRRAKERNKELEITINEVQDVRTAEQNSLFHVLIRRLAQQSGASEEWMKDYIKSEAVNQGYPVYVENGEIVTDAEGTAQPKPTSQATVTELMLLIEVCYQIAFDNGMDISKDI